MGRRGSPRLIAPTGQSGKSLIGGEEDAGGTKCPAGSGAVETAVELTSPSQTNPPFYILKRHTLSSNYQPRRDLYDDHLLLLANIITVAWASCSQYGEDGRNTKSVMLMQVYACQV